ncbi:MAG: OsmC family protein [Dermatophilaceae bacterium]
MSSPSQAPASDGHREVSLTRVEAGRYAVTNPRGGTVLIGRGADADYTATELLLAAMAACTAIDVDEVTSRRVDPQEFRVRACGTKVADELGNHLTDVTLRFELAFPDTEAGAQAGALVERVVRLSHDKLCTVSRTVMLPTPVRAVVGETVID